MKVTAEKIEQGAQLREAGRSLPWIARKVGMNVKTLEYHLRLRGVLPPGGMAPAPARAKPAYTRGGVVVRYYTPEEDAELQRLRLEGRRHSEIGRMMGRRPGSVRARLIALALRAESEEGV